MIVLFNKPYGVLSQFTDKEGRRTLSDFISIKDVYPAGRLDMDSEGLLVLTDEGDIQHDLSSPFMSTEKTYIVQVEGVPSDEQLQLLRKGVRIDSGMTLPAKARVLPVPEWLWERPVAVRYRRTVPDSWLEIRIKEGKNRQVRKMTAKVGLPCLRLVRTAVGEYRLGGLEPGEFKIVSAE